jgi:hypothetical protein
MLDFLGLIATLRNLKFMEMKGGASSTYGEEEKCRQSFGEDSWREETTWNA